MSNATNKISAPQSFGEAEALVLSMTFTSSVLNAKLAERDKRMAEVRQECDVAIKRSEEKFLAQREALEVWARKTTFPDGKKSLEFCAGTIGFRKGPPKLKTLLKRKWDDVLNALRRKKWGMAYVRVKEEVNKEQIIADFGAGILGAKEMRGVHAEVVQEESFFVELK